MARGRVQGWVEQGGEKVVTDSRQSITDVQESFPLATITVFNTGTVTPSTIFSTEGGVPLANPFLASDIGFWFFWVDQGRYDIQFSGAGIDTPFLYTAVDVVPSSASLGDPGANGIVVRTALGVTTARTLTQPAAGITIANPNGVAGNPTFALANDLAAVEALATNGLATRTGVDTWTTRTVTGTANNVTVTNGDGVAGNPTINIGANVVINDGGVVVDNALVRFDGTTGRDIQTSPVIVADTSGAFTVPDGWSVTDASAVAIVLNVGVITISIPTGTLLTLWSEVAAAQTQAAGAVQVHRYQTTYNQSGTAGSQDIALVRVETALGSGEHNFLRCFNGAAGVTLAYRIDRLGNTFIGTTGRFIGDANGNEIVIFNFVAAAVNEWTFTNAITGGTPTLAITGTDANPNGRIQAKGTGRIIIPGYAFCLDSTSNVVGNTLAALTTLNSFTLVAATLVANNDFVEFAYAGTFATNDNDKRITMTIDGQTIFDNLLFDLDGVIPNNQWSITGDIVRISATSVICTANLMQGQISATGAVVVGGNAIIAGRAVTLTVSNLGTLPVILLLSAQGTATNDITKTKSIVKVTQRT